MRWLGIASIALACGALAAPDEERLGKAEGYPLCRPGPETSTTRCLIGVTTRADEIYPARKVAKGDRVLPLKRAAKEPPIRFQHGNWFVDIDDYLSRNRTTGLLVLQDDTILVERYQYDRGPAHRLASYSMAKTIVAMLVGIAVSEGKIKSIDERAEAYVPELKGTAYGETPIRHLLSMSSGVPFTENYGGNDDVAAMGRLVFTDAKGGAATLAPFRDRARDRAPGERFSYASSETQVLGLVLRAAVGRPLADYASEKLWRPMGAEADASWILDRGGHEIGYAAFNATLRDWARFGLLLANDGALDGRQIIPAAWVRAATTPPADQFRPGQADAFYGYGYQTWILPGQERLFTARGLRGQLLCVNPRTKVVVAHTAAREVSGDAGYREAVSLCMGVLTTLGNT